MVSLMLMVHPDLSLVRCDATLMRTGKRHGYPSPQR